MSDRKYNYVIFGSGWDLYKQSFSDIIPLEDAIYISDEFSQIKFLRSHPLYYLHFSQTINRRINLPLKSIWNNIYFKNSFQNDKPLCFVFCNSWSELNGDIKLSSFLKKKYKHSKTVMFITDLFNTKTYSYSKKPFDIDRERLLYDYIISFDQEDCRKYDLIYHPLVYSKYKGTLASIISSDIYFLGKPKNRLNMVLDAFRFLKDTGCKLDFYLVGVNENDKKYADEIHYLENLMSYSDNIKHLLQSKCVLEIMQQGGHGYTQRGVEVLGENKKLLTNNPEVKDAPFYNNRYISVFNRVQDIDLNFIYSLKNEEEHVDYCWADKVSPIELLNFIDSKVLR